MILFSDSELVLAEELGLRFILNKSKWWEFCFKFTFQNAELTET